MIVILKARERSDGKVQRGDRCDPFKLASPNKSEEPAA
jgi:hypothetical protein